MRSIDGELDHPGSATVDLAVIVVHWRVLELLVDCLESLDRQRTHSNLSITTLVVDAHSEIPDLRSMLAPFPEVELFELDENPGYAACCNIGIRATNSQAVLLLNADTVMLDGSVDRMWETLTVSEHVGLVAPLLLNPDRSLQSAGYRFPGLSNLVFDFLPVHPRLVESTLNGRVHPGNGETPVEVDYPLGAAMMLRRSVLDAVGYLSEDYVMYCEEIDLCRRLEAVGWTRLLQPAAQVIHASGASTGQQPEKMNQLLWRSRALYYWRWGSRRDRLAAAWLIRANRALRSTSFERSIRPIDESTANAFRNREVGLRE